MNKIILTDVDGVLLNWVKTFEAWMVTKGYKKHIDGEYDIDKTYNIHWEEAKKLAIEFNNSNELVSMPPFMDAVKYVKKLHEEQGYVLHCVSAVPERSLGIRRNNLEQIFGEAVIERVECTGTSANKRPILAEYTDTGIPWLEDKFSNCKMGLDYGLDCYLMIHDYNEYYDHHDDITRVRNWKEIYEHLTN